MEIRSSANGVPFLAISDFLDSSLFEAALKEAQSLQGLGLLRSPQHTGSASDENGMPTKKNKGVFLDELYAGCRNHSKLLSVSRRFFEDDAIKDAILSHQSFIFNEGWIYESNFDASLLSYYESHDEYKAHRDASDFTLLTWLYEEPKRFSGGNLVFPVSGEEISLQNNFAILFPSCCKHLVTEVQMEEGAQNKCLGRFTLSVFIATLRSLAPMATQHPTGNLAAARHP